MPLMKGGNMSKTFLFTLMILMLALSLQACVPGQPTPDLNTIHTAVAQTLSATTQTARPEIPVTGDGSPTPTSALGTVAPPTSTSVPATTSPVPTETSVPATSATPILTPGVVQVYVSVPTNCRLGPSVSYTRVGGLQLGQVANVVGRNATGDYWIIRNPSRTGEICWLWGQYATVVGDTSDLPVFTPPPLPTPAPSFNASLNGLESCADTGNWWLDINIENNGGITFRSFFMTVRDTVTGTELSLYQDNFIDRDGCNASEDQGDLDPGDAFIVSSPAFTYDPSGHRIHTRITLCSSAGQAGTCLSHSYDFTP
jgi:hypothetical protein